MKVYCIMLEHYDVDTFSVWLELKKIFNSKEAAVTWLEKKECEVNEYYTNEYHNRSTGEWYEIIEKEVE